MDSGTGRKRPWEEDSPVGIQPRHRDLTSAARETAVPPLPQHAGWHAHDIQDQVSRRLPPLYPPSCGTSAEIVAVGSLPSSSALFETGGVERPKLRSQSLFDVFQPKRQRLQDVEEPSVTYFGGLDPNRSLPPLATNTQSLQLGSDPAPREQGPIICCSSTCSGPTCAKLRILVQRLTSELSTLNRKVQSILHSGPQLLKETPQVEGSGPEKSLQWAIELVQWNNLKLQDYTEGLGARMSEQGLFQGESASKRESFEIMKSGQQHLDRDDNSSSSRPPPASMYEFPRFPNPTGMAEDNRRSLHHSDFPPISHSPQPTASPSGSIFIPPQSPLQGSQPLRTGMLPSPSSMNFPSGSGMPPISPPTSSLQTSAQAVHLQDLQHQVSIKTLAFQTLQREYDSLLQKLERQRTKCATLEKKFAVSDVEINTLTDEKEKLQAQVATLEAQVEELQQSRDESRKQLVANGAQYMRIMDMASRLQAQGAEDKKRWAAEKLELERRVKILEEAMVTGAERPDASTVDASEQHRPTPAGQLGSPTAALMSSVSASSAETIAVLRTEIARLRSRTQSLETALQIMRDESISIRAAAQSLVASGIKIKDAADAGLGG
ncbi:hypothetical protein K432DRAFT_400264 [Lepidopterella palustris CBS 459.81]|uniref:Uncharacterized protein n=1 Tax=Lepidopterella palustris CBS 459.81 TaxID=1314670 RepID=A0A8E2JK40_9PEZI|nr:hypothetical protein K432DRAFT_400264 [Lepidopterella palustris CBS 459.81]